MREVQYERLACYAVITGLCLLSLYYVQKMQKGFSMLSLIFAHLRAHQLTPSFTREVFFANSGHVESFTEKDGLLLSQKVRSRFHGNFFNSLVCDIIITFIVSVFTMYFEEWYTFFLWPLRAKKGY